jgi:hypothetical protein
MDVEHRIKHHNDTEEVGRPSVTHEKRTFHKAKTGYIPVEEAS